MPGDGSLYRRQKFLHRAGVDAVFLAEQGDGLTGELRIAGVEAQTPVRREAAHQLAADKGTAHALGREVIGHDLVVCLQAHRGRELGKVDERVGPLPGVVAAL